MNIETALTGVRTLAIAVAAAALAAGCAGTGSSQDKSDSGATAEVRKASADADAEIATTDTKDPGAMRCKRISETGSRVKKKVCATNREWDISAQKAREATEEYQRSSAVGRAGD